MGLDLLSGHRDRTVARDVAFLVTLEAASFSNSLLPFSRSFWSVVQDVKLHFYRISGLLSTRSRTCYREVSEVVVVQRD
jgi:hypothetical protein